jgi:hypothetical protein
LCLLYLLIQVMQLFHKRLCPWLKPDNTFISYLFTEFCAKIRSNLHFYFWQWVNVKCTDSYIVSPSEPMHSVVRI